MMCPIFFARFYDEKAENDSNRTDIDEKMYQEFVIYLRGILSKIYYFFKPRVYHLGLCFFKKGDTAASPFYIIHYSLKIP